MLCGLRAAFDRDKCYSCKENIRKYGNSIQCDGCKKMCAFRKPLRENERPRQHNYCKLCDLKNKIKNSSEEVI